VNTTAAAAALTAGISELTRMGSLCMLDSGHQSVPVLCLDFSYHCDLLSAFVTVGTATSHGPHEPADEACRNVGAPQVPTFDAHVTPRVSNGQKCLESPICRSLFPDTFLAIICKYRLKSNK